MNNLNLVLFFSIMAVTLAIIVFLVLLIRKDIKAMATEPTTFIIFYKDGHYETVIPIKDVAGVMRYNDQNKPITFNVSLGCQKLSKEPLKGWMLPKVMDLAAEGKDPMTFDWQAEYKVQAEKRKFDF